MIVLATGNATIRREGDLTFVSMPSGDGEPITLALTRHQLASLAMSSGKAVTEAFNEPPPDLVNVKPIRRKRTVR
ncbi:hypothetical protein SAMN04488060_0866 [Qipengyuania nanhaisediminis]|uniref:Uncharacterized protein n=1 Tax=Qipengyuania nanhaisediminis TaxID=604088 RepID=A0A1I5LAJ6_9SPHN|nr:hypothetical protein SAMN04488060_0866 [Qipengyuania nanhaisediminis]